MLYLALINLGSLCAFVAGLINPRWVLIGEKRTRIKSSKLYFAVWFVSILVIGTANGELQSDVAQLPIVPNVASPISTPKISPTPAPIIEVQNTPSPTPHIEVTPAPIIEAQTQAFDPAICSTQAYLPANGASIALYTVCQLIQADSIKPESVSLINASELEDWVAEAGYEKYSWVDLSLALDNKRDACIVYKDKSVSCLQFSLAESVEADNEPEQQPSTSNKQTTTTPISGSTCANFATQSDAQAALATNPRLDGNSDGVACESYFNSGGDSSHSTRHRRRKK